MVKADIKVKDWEMGGFPNGLDNPNLITWGLKSRTLLGCLLVAMGGWAVRETHVAGFEDGGRKPPDRECGMLLEAGKSQEMGSPWSLQKAQTSHISAQ